MVAVPHSRRNGLVHEALFETAQELLETTDVRLYQGTPWLLARPSWPHRHVFVAR